MLIGHQIRKYEKDIAHHISELVKIRSVREEAQPGMPFGKGVNRALEYMLSLAESMGFTTKNVDGYAGHAEYGNGENIAAIVVHLDTVHEGEGWSVPPFGGVMRDGKIMGRGASDNKGPAVVALYCLLAIKELGLPIRSRIRVIFGTNEESGMEDLDYYFSKEPLPDVAFVPDAGYPLFHVEMGNTVVKIGGKLDQKPREGRLPVVSLEAGVPFMLTPASCRMLVKSEESLDEWMKRIGERPEWTVGKEPDGLLAVTSREASGNPIASMAEWVSELSCRTDADALFSFLREKLGHETNGESLGIACSDEESGAAVVFLKQLVTEDDTVSAVINIRYPVTADGDRLLERVKEQAASYGLTMDVTRHLRPVYFSPDDPLVRTLSGVYEKMTGDKAELLRMGAGTYARKLQGRGLAFGAGLRGGSDTNVHRPDEFIVLEEMMKHAEICLQAIYELASGPKF